MTSKANESIIGSAWSSSTGYSVGALVMYNNGIYRCKVACTGVLPTNTSYWSPNTLETLLSLKVETLQQDVTYYVNASTGNDSNDGLSASTAKKTINGTLSIIPKSLGSHQVVISVASGTYEEDVVIEGFSGGKASQGLLLLGDSTTKPIIKTLFVSGCTSPIDVEYFSVVGLRKRMDTYPTGSWNDLTDVSVAREQINVFASYATFDYISCQYDSTYYATLTGQSNGIHVCNASHVQIFNSSINNCFYSIWYEKTSIGRVERCTETVDDTTVGKSLYSGNSLITTYGNTFQRAVGSSNGGQIFTETGYTNAEINTLLAQKISNQNNTFIVRTTDSSSTQYIKVCSFTWSQYGDYGIQLHLTGRSCSFYVYACNPGSYSRPTSTSGDVIFKYWGYKTSYVEPKIQYDSSTGLYTLWFASTGWNRGMLISYTVHPYTPNFIYYGTETTTDPGWSSFTSPTSLY